MACFEYGTYHNLVPKYNNKTEISVKCDRCHTVNLTKAIRYGSTDLCIQCVADIDRKVKNKILSNNMEEFNPIPIIMQNMYK
jgi:hypothetical protein